MEIVYIIGNGFDLNLGLKTSYKDFYTFYKSLPEERTTIKKLKNSISNNFETWSDLELGLGEYTSNINSLEEFDEVYEDISEKLSEYLLNQEASFNYERIEQHKVDDYLSKPEKSLPPSLANEIKEYKNGWSNSFWNVHIITLNYTTVIDKVINKDTKNRQIGFNGKKNPIILQNLEHLHGYTNNRMILGVNDINQLSNSSFQKDQNIIEAIVKPQSNKASYDIVDAKCSSLISKANLICVFGCSIGATDKIWWNLIAQQLKRDCKLILFSKSEEIPKRISYKINRPIRYIKDDFLRKANLENDKAKEIVLNNIIVGNNTDFFSDIYKS
jgi:hypothetical protein